MICTRVGGAECTDLLQALWFFLPQSCMSYLSMSYWQTTGKKMQDVSLSHVLQQQLPTVGSIRRHEAVPQHRKVGFFTRTCRKVLLEMSSNMCCEWLDAHVYMDTWTHVCVDVVNEAWSSGSLSQTSSTGLMYGGFTAALSLMYKTVCTFVHCIYCFMRF